ncbi:MAG: hypothetical protein ABFS86_03980 [Planctomycetota bacterium]
MSALAVATDLEMGLGAWLMLFFAVLVLGGGLFLSIRRAMAVERDRRSAEGTFEGGDGE